MSKDEEVQKLILPNCIHKYMVVLKIIVLKDIHAKILKHKSMSQFCE